ncbi:MAG TPA: lytic transglycosylase domain-containing protein [Pseudonocardiaceae bacterium]|jgi:hypothetical protein|nr:lytic transglycosylase domain-containing protein [Pseudonocardiaceae bacterium]
MAILASALVVLPAALSADVAVNFVATADQSPFAAPRTLPAGNVPNALGATGASPHDTTLSPAILHNAGNAAALQRALGTGSNGQLSNLPSGPLGIPGVVLDAYLHAQQVMKVDSPGCNLPWWLLAGIGKIESNQAEHGEVDTNGTTFRPILGPELNGSNGFAALPAINGGQWTGDPVWQRAVGPMQFLPSTWLRWGHGGNPNNVYDAALAAGRYLCSGGGDLSQPADQATAVFSYNHSDSYVQMVLIWANAYRNGVTPLPETVVSPQGPMPPGLVSHPTGGGGGTVPGRGGGSPTRPAGGGTAPGHPSAPAGSKPGGSSAPTTSRSPSPTFTMPGRPSSSSPTTTPPTSPSPTCPTPDPTATPTPTSTTPPPPGCPTTTTPPPTSGAAGSAVASGTESAAAPSS